MFFDESTKNLNENYVGIQTSSLFLYEAEYRDYLDTKISNQNNIFRSIAKYTGVNESSVVMLEAVGDKIKSKWNNLIEFIKKIAAKFMESITNILLNQKDYLEKYKEIILRKPPKSGMKFSYIGDYDVGIDRIINTELPLFNYSAMAEHLKKEGDLPTIQEVILKDRSFDYDESKEMAENFKNYFIAADKGETSGTFDQLKMVDLYNFCINFNKIEQIKNKDMARLTNSTNAIQAAMNEEIRKAGATNESAILYSINEAPKGDQSQSVEKAQSDGTTKTTTTTPETTNAKPKGVKITNTDAIGQSSSYADKDKKDNNAENNAKGASGELKDKEGKDVTAEDAEKAVSDMAEKWIKISRNLITAKFTAIEQISKDYMAIIRAHVRSYGGQDLKKVDDRTEKVTNYQKRSTTENKEADNQTERK